MLSANYRFNFSLLSNGGTTLKKLFASQKELLPIVCSLSLFVILVMLLANYRFNFSLLSNGGTTLKKLFASQKELLPIVCSLSLFEILIICLLIRSLSLFCAIFYTGLKV